MRADVRGHHHDRVGEVDGAALAVGQAAVVEELQQDVRHIGMRLLHLVEEHDAVRTTAHGLSQLAALVVADVSRRRADQARHRVLLHVLAHVDAHDRLLRVEQVVGERLAELGLADAGRAEEEKRPDRPVRLAEARAIAAHGLAHRAHGLALSDDARGEHLLHVQQLLALALDELRHGDARPLGDDLGDLLAVDFLLDHRGAVGLSLAERILGGLELLLELAQLAVLDARRALEVAAALGLVELGVLALDVVLHALDRVELLLLELPARGHAAVLLVELGEVLLDRGETLLALGVLLELERLALDLELHDAALDLVEFRGHRVVLDAQARRGLVEQVDRLVGQKAVRDVALRQRRRAHERAVLDAHAVVRLVAALESAQDRDRVLDRRLAHEDGLETPLERGVLLDMLAVLVERGRADAAQLAARERRLEQLARARRTLGLARAHDRVQLVDEQDDAAFARRDLAQDRLESLLELAAELGARQQLADVEADDARIAHRLGAVAVHDADREAFGDRGLADAGLADEHGVVLGAARKHLHAAADLLVAADDGIDLALLRLLDEVDAVLLERLVVRLGVLVGDVGHARRLADRLDGRQHALAVDAERGEHFLGAALHVGEREHEVLGRDVGVLHLLRVAFGGREDLRELARRVVGRAALHARQPTELGLRDIEHARGIDAGLLQQGIGGGSLLRQQRREQVQRRDLRVARGVRGRLSGGECFLGEGGESFESHGGWVFLLARVFALELRGRRRKQSLRQPSIAASGAGTGENTCRMA